MDASRTEAGFLICVKGFKTPPPKGRKNLKKDWPLRGGKQNTPADFGLRIWPPGELNTLQPPKTRARRG
jgi:hypothetical protein